MVYATKKIPSQACFHWVHNSCFNLPDRLIKTHDLQAMYLTKKRKSSAWTANINYLYATNFLSLNLID